MFGYGGVSSALTENDSNASASLMSVVFLTLTFTLFFSSTLWNTVIPGGWSIQAEVFHYLLFVFLRRFQIAILFLVAGILNILSSLVFLLTSSQKNFGGLFFLLADSWSRLSLFSTFSFFSIGIIFGFLIDKGFEDFIQAIRGNRKLYFSLGFFTLSMFTIPTPFGKTLEDVGTVVGFIVLSFYLTEKSLLNLFFVSLGKYSYFIYFAHFIVLDFVAWVTRRLVLNFDFLFSQKIILPPLILCVLAISWVLGYLSFRFIERPIINWSRKFC
jgi:peptidoglycan/LPS O-acetylase OafA/YrhL